MRKHKKVLSIMLMVLILATVAPSNPLFNNVLTVEAHSGRTDGSGGHHDYKNKSGLGSYHYHCGGHPAHLHPNGICPYSGSKTSTSNSSQSTKPNIQDQSAALIKKYKSITDEFDNKKKSGYFRKDVDAIMMQAINADSNAADVFITSLMTPEEIADLVPINTETKKTIVGKISYMRVYEAFLSQVVAQEQQAAMAQSNIQDGANISNDDVLFKLVSQTQTALTVLGLYTGEIDGIFDEETQQAVINFQTMYGLTIDGTINEQVVMALGIQL